MNLLERNLKLITQILLLSVIAVVPFIKIDTLYFPFVSGKAYIFRALVAAAFFFWIWLMLKGKEWRPNIKNILVFSLVVFFLGQIAASFFGVDPLYSLFSSIERADGVLQYGFWLFYFLIFLSVFKKEQDWRMFFSVFAGTAFVLSVYSWFNYSSQVQLYGIFGNPAYFAAFLLFAIGFSLLVVERRFFDSRWINYAFFAVAGFLTVTLIFTQVRGAYVAFAGGILLFSMLSLLFLRKENKKLVFALASVLLVGFASLAILFAAKETEFVQSTRLLYRVTEVTEIWEKNSTRERLLNWNIALKAFKERPVFGYGPENYASAANKYYDYRIGVGEPWFDRAHNQSLDTLATGGIVVFSLHLFWLLAASFLIFKIKKQKKVLSFLLASIFFAYFLQGFFLFDLLAVYLGLFPFLAFLLFTYNSIKKEKGGKSQKQLSTEKPAPAANMVRHLPILGLVGLLSLFVMYTTAFLPYKANAAAIQFYAYSENGFFKESMPFLEKAFSTRSPYTYWEVRKRAGWQLAGVLRNQIGEETPAKKIKEAHDLYSYLVPELEKFIDARPFDPQMYYVLGRTYRLGFQRLGRDDLEKAKIILEKGFEYSELRVEYVNEFAQVLLLQGRIEEAEQLVKDYAQRVNFEETFPYTTLGNFYFVGGKYEQALEQYEKAREAGYKFYDVKTEYSRYLVSAGEIGDYQKVVDMALSYLERWGPDANTYFNVAVGYLNLGDKEHAKEFFLKAVELDSKYREKESFFLE